ncbi:hypothetical protein JW979_03910 [bacterium]|nr:hypothetical protein [candidate division CSSED10-310 bacterium]
MNSGRPLKPLVVSLLLMGLAVFSLSWLNLNGTPSPKQRFNYLSHYKTALAYRIGHNETACFRIHPQTNVIEIVSNLDLPFSKSYPWDADRQYGLVVTLLNNERKLVSKETYYETTSITKWMDVKTGEEMCTAFYRDGSIIPADSRITTIHLPSNRTADCYISINLAQTDCESASIRLYQHVDIIQDSELSAVKPVSRHLKAKLSRHNLYGNKVNEFELRRFLSNVWEQIPADGRSGISYIPREIHITKDTIPILGDTPPNGFELNQTQPLMLPLNDHADVTVEFSSTGTINVRKLYADGSSISDEIPVTSDCRHVISSGEGACLFEISPVEGSMFLKHIDVSPASACKPFLNPEIKNLLNPYRITTYYNGFSESDGDPIEISVSEYAIEKNLPCKVVCRVPMAPDETCKEEIVSCTYINNQNTEIGNYSHKISTYPSVLAAFCDSTMKRLQPSYPEKFYIFPPKGTAKICFSSSSQVSMAFFSCLPSSNAQTIEISENAFDSHRMDLVFDDESRLQNWFYFRPVNYQQLSEQKRSVSVRIPTGVYELPSNESSLKADESRKGFSHYPDTFRIEKIIYESIPAEKAADHTTYRYVTLSPMVPVTFSITGSPDLLQNVSINYKLVSYTEPLIEIYLDGVKHMSFRPIAPQGRFRLPGILSGNHSIEVRSTCLEDQFLLRLESNMTVPTEILSAKTVFEMIPGETLKITVHKPDRNSQYLNIMLYQYESDDSKLNISVFADIKDHRLNGEFATSLTASERIYTGVINSDNRDVWLSELSGKHPMKSRRIAFPLHDDLPAGSYELKLQSNSDTPVYVRFFTMELDMI